MSKDETFNHVLQPIIQLSPGDTIEATVFPDDLGYGVDWDVCAPCKMIRIINVHTGLELRLSWGAPNLDLSLWLVGGTRYQNASEIVVSIPIPAAHATSLVEVGVLVGFDRSPATSQPFRLAVIPR